MSIVVSKIGRRPIRSDTRPSSAVARNCIAEKTKMRAPYPMPVRAEALRVHGQDRQHDPEPDQVDQDREENDGEA